MLGFSIFECASHNPQAMTKERTSKGGQKYNDYYRERLS
jgi:hypothetical protein